MESTWGPEFVTDPTAEAEVPAGPDETTDDEDTGVIPPPQPEPDRSSLSRALRDLEAAKQRVERDATRARDQLREELVAALFPVLDNLDRTIAVAQRNHEAPTVVEGVHLVRRQLAQTLERYGVQRIEARGQPFDPQRHEAISVVVVDDPRHDRVVVDQLEPGYTMGKRLLRPAKVVVGRARYH
jgi:molecular chaperone GrpE (heat shock protein)